MTQRLLHGQPVIADTRNGKIAATVVHDDGERVEVAWTDEGLGHFVTLDRDLIEPVTWERLGELASEGLDDEHRVDWSEGLYMGGSRCYQPILNAFNATAARVVEECQR